MLNAHAECGNIARLAAHSIGARASALARRQRARARRARRRRVGAKFSTSFASGAASDAALYSHEQRRHFAPSRTVARAMLEKRDFGSEKSRARLKLK